MKKVQRQIKTPIRSLYLVASENSLVGISFEKQNLPMVKTLAKSSPEIKILRRAARQLGEYFSGKRKKFDLPLDAQGTSFQKRVWRELRKIPYGVTRSYKDIASRIRKPKAARAVGAANGMNPICIIVPCHRVVAHDGRIGGYSGGLRIKKRLLQLEQDSRPGGVR